MRPLKTFVLAVLLLGPLPAVLYSCNRCDDDLADTCRYITAISATGYDNSDSIRQAIHGPVPARAFLLELGVMDSTAVCYNRSSRVPELIPVAHATHCRGFIAYDVDQLDSLRITSDAAFDATHPAGTDLRALFYPVVDAMTAGSHDYLLVASPTVAGQHRFAVTCSFGSGKVLTDTLSPVTLVP